MHPKMATFNVVICQNEPENRPRIEEEGIYLCLVTYKKEGRIRLCYFEQGTKNT